MDGTRFQRLAEIFEAARERDGAARDAFLREVCAGDDDLRRDVDKLLAQHDAAESAGEDLLQAGSALREALQTGTESDVEEPVPAQVGRYRIRGAIARGGFGLVLRGEDTTIGRDVAVKILAPAHAGNQKLGRLLRSEGRIGGKLQHPGIVPVYELGDLDSRSPFLVMKVVEGRTLSALLRERSDPGSDRARFLAVFEQVCQAVAYAHARGVLHRDLKPHNLMVGAFGEVQVMDWGLAVVFGEGVEPDADAYVALGTPAYMAPEQARGEARALDPRSDVFGLGAILCEILTGRPPFADAGQATTLDRARAGDLAEAHARIAACGADKEIVALALQCLAPDPARRPADARAVAAAVRTHLDSLDARARTAELDAASARARAASERKARRTTTALGVVIVVATLLGAAVWLQVTNAARERERTATARLQAALVDAERSASDAAAEQPQTSLRWQTAATAASNARRLIGTDTDAAVAAQAEALQARVALRLHEVTFAERLEEIALEERFLDSFDRRGQLAAYEQAFTEFVGGDADHLSVEDAHEALVGFPFRGRLITALDQWMFLQFQRDRNAMRLGWLRTLADALDDDAWRRDVRAAVAVADRDALVQLARDARADAAPPSACSYLAVRLATLGDTINAVALMERTVRRAPDDFETAYNLAIMHSDTGSFIEAVRYGTAACALRAGSALPWSLLASALHQAGRAEEAVFAARRTIELAHESLGPSVLAADILFEADLVADAEAVVRDYRLMPRNHVLFCVASAIMGNVLAVRDDFAGAVDAYAECVSSPVAWPFDPRWRLQSPAVVAGLQREIDARLAQSEGKDPVVLYLAARLREDLGRLREALSAYEELERLRPNFKATRIKIRELGAQLGGALSSFGAADRFVAALDPTQGDEEARRALTAEAGAGLAAVPAVRDFAEGRLLARAGKLSAALDYLTRAVEGDREAPLPWVRLHETWVAHAGRARADAEVRALLAKGAMPARLLPIPPASPRCVAPADGAPVRDGEGLRVDGFAAADPRQRHVHTLWQVRAIADDYARSPAVDVLAGDDPALEIPPGILAAGQTYAWRAAFACDAPGTMSAFSEERTFRVADDACHPVPIDLRTVFDADVVAEPGDSGTDAFDPPNAFRLAVDGCDGARTDVASVQGVPPDGRVGVHRLGPFAAANSRQLRPGMTNLRIPIPEASYQSILVLAASGNGNAYVPVLILYADGTADHANLIAPDWFSSGRPADLSRRSGQHVLRGMDRAGPAGIEERNAAALFQSRLPCDPERRVVGIELRSAGARFDSATTVTNLLAITGMAVSGSGGK
ncbi:MAG: protein kinase [Planctomycetota bacterium]